jgi:hypothetical protein
MSHFSSPINLSASALSQAHWQMAVALLTTSFSSLASATSFAAIPLDELYLKSDKVVVLRIVSGRSLHNKGFDCGAQYTAEVIQVLKGDVKPGTMEFGRAEGYGMGWHYLAFLSTTGKSHAPLRSTNTEGMRQMAQYQQNCSSAWPSINLLNGSSAYRASWYEEKWKSSRSIMLAKYSVELPERGLVENKALETYLTSEDHVFVPLVDLIDYFSRLQAGTAIAPTQYSPSEKTLPNK